MSYLWSPFVNRLCPHFFVINLIMKINGINSNNYLEPLFWAASYNFLLIKILGEAHWGGILQGGIIRGELTWGKFDRGELAGGN